MSKKSSEKTLFFIKKIKNIFLTKDNKSKKKQLDDDCDYFPTNKSQQPKKKKVNVPKKPTRPEPKILYSSSNPEIKELLDSESDDIDNLIKKISEKDSILESISQGSTLSIPSKTPEKKNRGDLEKSVNSQPKKKITKPKDKIVSPLKLDGNISFEEKTKSKQNQEVIDEEEEQQEEKEQQIVEVNFFDEKQDKDEKQINSCDDLPQLLNFFGLDQDSYFIRVAEQKPIELLDYLQKIRSAMKEMVLDKMGPIMENYQFEFNKFENCLFKICSKMWFSPSNNPIVEEKPKIQQFKSKEDIFQKVLCFFDLQNFTHIMIERSLPLFPLKRALLLATTKKDGPFFQIYMENWIPEGAIIFYNFQKNVSKQSNGSEFEVYKITDYNFLCCSNLFQLLHGRPLSRIAVSKTITKLRQNHSKFNTVIDKNDLLSTKFIKPTENFIDWNEEEVTLENDTYLLDPTSRLSTSNKPNLKYNIKMAKAAKQYKELENKKRGSDKVVLLTKKTENKKQKKEVFFPTVHHIGNMVLICEEEGEYYCNKPLQTHMNFLEKRQDKWYLKKEFLDMAKLG